MEYFIKAESNSGHCCFEYSVMVKHESGEEEVLCECFNEEDALTVLTALNSTKFV